MGNKSRVKWVIVRTSGPPSEKAIRNFIQELLRNTGREDMTRKGGARQ